MGVSCMAANTIGYYCCCRSDEYQGNKIFRPIGNELLVEGGNEEENKILEECRQRLNNSEQERQKIADKFKILLRDTGAGVLTKPTLERALITYVLYFFEQIMLCAQRKNKEFNKDDFSFSNFITLTKESPFFEFNRQALDEIKTKYGFDYNMIESLVKGQRSIIDFLTTIKGTEPIIKNQYNIIKHFLDIKIITNTKLISVIKDCLNGIYFIINYFTELTTSFILAQNQLANPIKLELFFRIASDAAKKEIDDPREIALIYSYGENCGDKDKWEENCVYKPMEILKY